MRQQWSRALLAALIWSLSAAAIAQEQKAPKAAPVPVLYRLTCWEVDDTTYHALRGQAKADPAKLKGRRIQEAELLTVSGEESLVHVGQKEPLVYYDARASRFNIQFVDIGFKLDVMWDGDTLEVRPELSDLQSLVTADESGRVARYPQTQVQICEATFTGVRLGDTYVISAAAGAAATAQVRVLDPTPKAKNLIMTLSLEAP